MRNRTEAISLAAELRAPPTTRMRMGVERFSPSASLAGTSMTMLPTLSMRPANLGGTTTVESYCSMMAGPSKAWPAPIFSRS